jgi:hypothetical protein
MSDTYIYALVMIFKVIQGIGSYASAAIASTMFHRTYIDKMYVLNEKPPHLISLVALFLVIELVFMIFLFITVYAFIMMLTNVMGINLNMDNSTLFTIILRDTAYRLLIMAIVGAVTATTMYNKKYFMYNDDGLRAIRALETMMFQYSTGINSVLVLIMMESMQGGASMNWSALMNCMKNSATKPASIA